MRASSTVYASDIATLKHHALATGKSRVNILHTPLLSNTNSTMFFVVSAKAVAGGGVRWLLFPCGIEASTQCGLPFKHPHTASDPST